MRMEGVKGSADCHLESSRGQWHQSTGLKEARKEMREEQSRQDSQRSPRGGSCLSPQNSTWAGAIGA